MSTTGARRTTPARRVNFLENRNDFESVVLGSLGFSYQYIGSRTGLTKCQVGYRLHKASERVGEYRDGTSQVAKAVQDGAWMVATKIAKKKLAPRRSGR